MRNVGPGMDLLQSLTLRPVSIDDLSNVRYIHSGAFRLMAASCYSDEEIAAFSAYVYTVAYGEVIQRENMLAGFLDNEMVATASWVHADDDSNSARIRSLYVRPLFFGLGISRFMAQAAESSARKSGLRNFGARVTLNAVGFFEAIGYEVTSHGVQLLPANQGMPVTFMRKCDRSAPRAIIAEQETT